MRSWKLTTAFFLSASSLLVQGRDISKLDFESAVLVSVVRLLFSSLLLFPGWTCTIGTNVIGAALYDRAALDSSAISIIDHSLDESGFSFGRVIEGKFTAVLQAGVSGPSITNVADTTISQTGLVPIPHNHCASNRAGSR